MKQFFEKLKCKWLGHNWSWVFDDVDYQQHLAGACQRCGEIGDGAAPREPEYPQKEDSLGITKKGF